MTDKPEKPLSERIRDAQFELGMAISNHRFDDNPVRVASASLKIHTATLGFLAELAEMMEKK